MLEINKNKLVPGIVATWGDITGNISNQSDLVEYISSHGGGNAEWGSISGNISDQSDLMSTLGSYATESWVSEQGYITSIPDTFATKAWVTDQGYLTSVPSEYATQSWVSEQGYLTSETLPSDLATESWVESQGYLTEHQSLKTINGESIVGSGDIEVGGLTPEQEDAVEILTDSSKGVLYTNQIDPYIVTSKPNQYIFDSMGIYQVDDDVYYFYNLELSKFNKDTLNYDHITRLNQSAGSSLWRDATGRLYDGRDYMIDIENSTLVYVETGAIYFEVYDGRNNILYGQYGIWCVDQNNLQKFDEATQKFISGYTVNVPEGYSDSLSWYMTRSFKYDGHILYDNDTKTYEIVEYEDHIDVVDVTDRYYTRPSFSMDTRRIFGTDSGLFYLSEADHYKYDPSNQVWNRISISGQNTYFSYRYGVSGDFVVGGFYSPIGEYNIINLGDTWKATSWTEVKNVAVDLSSDQRIKGQKIFDGTITTSSINVGSSFYGDGYIALGAQKSLINATRDLNITAGGLCTLNNKTIAVTDQCILNRSVSYPGPRFESVVAISGMNVEPRYYFVTPSGRLIYCDSTVAYEFDGTQWVQLQTVTNFVVSEWRAELSDGLYAVNQSNNSLYKWDDTNSDWVFIIQAPYVEIWAADANTLRSNASFKLVNNGGTYEWIEDGVNNYNFQRSYKLGQTYYYAYNDQMYTYDESLKTFTNIGNTQWPDNGYRFVFNGCLYYCVGGYIRKTDPSQVGTDQWDVRTNIYYTSWNNMYAEYDNKIWTIDNSGSPNPFGYTYDVVESLPEVPAANGTYVLKATVLNGQVTFSWVVDEVAQAVQITNEILG